MLWIIPGSPNGLDPAASSAHHADTPGFPGSVHTEPNLGGGLDAEGEPFLIIGAGRRGRSRLPLAGRNDHADHPGRSGCRRDRRAGDEFGLMLAASARHFVVGAPWERLGAVRGGMAHVFAHPTGSGASVELTSFHQDTPGISGSAEKTDAFGLAAVTSYRASLTAPIGALVSTATSRRAWRSSVGGSVYPTRSSTALSTTSARASTICTSTLNSMACTDDRGRTYMMDRVVTSFVSASTTESPPVREANVDGPSTGFAAIRPPVRDLPVRSSTLGDCFREGERFSHL